jgi:lipopolysaccharide export system protein LptA
MKNISTIIILFSIAALLASGANLSAQNTTKVKLIKADDLKYDKQLGEKVQRLVGNVILKHDSTYLYCDSAYLYETTNSFDGFGSVRIKVSDSLNVYSDILNYNGNSRIAELHHNVRLEENRATLYTEHLWYNRLTEIAWYTTGGRIIDSTNVLTSKKGYFYTNVNEAYFQDSVKLVNENYIMNSDSMMYNTQNETSYFYGPTTIESDSNFIYCEQGWYDTQNDKSFFKDHAYIITNEQILKGDSLYYDRNTDFGFAYGNVSLVDTVQNLIIGGHYGEFKKKAGYSFVTDSALAVMVDKNDSLFLHADTLWMRFDSSQNIEFLFAYHHSKFYRKDLQGMCDSLVYKFNDSTIFLYKDPVLWSEENQLTADSIRIALKNNQMDSLALLGSSFIISIDDSIRETYNQIRGKTIIAYFKNNQMAKIKVLSNAESIYFVRDDDNRLIGINIAVASDMQILLDSNQISSITYIKMPDAHMYPKDELTEEDLFLRNFKWITGQRPARKEDIFIW